MYKRPCLWLVLPILLLAAGSSFGARYNAQPVFTANRGQWDDSILFRSASPDAVVWLTRSARYYQLFQREGSAVWPRVQSGERFDRAKPRPMTFTRLAAVKLVGANTDAIVRGEGKAAYPTYFYTAKNHSRWHPGVPSYPVVTVQDVYPGIDCRYYYQNGQLEYDFVVAPGASAGVIRLEYEGMERASIDADGNLSLVTPWGSILERAPAAYQTVNGKQHRVASAYCRYDDGTIGFDLGWYDRGTALTLDPVLQFSTYLGGSGDDDYGHVKIAADGRIYVLGITNSADFPSVPAGDSALAGDNLVVAVLDSAGETLLGAAVLGPTILGMPGGLEIAADGACWVSSVTNSPDFPQVNSLQSYGGGPTDGVLLCLSPQLDTLRFSSFIGGSEDDYLSDVAAGPGGFVTVCGGTSSPDFPGHDPGSPTAGYLDALVARIDPAVPEIAWSRLFGGQDYDRFLCLALDNYGAVYAGGYTSSLDYPTLNAFQPIHGDADNPYSIFDDAMLTKVDASGETVFSTFFGGSAREGINGIAVDDEGYIHVCGVTGSIDFPLRNERQTWQGDDDAIVAKFTPNATDLVFSTCLGGTTQDHALAIDLDTAGNVCVTGLTFGNGFPSVNSFQEHAGYWDVFLTELSPSGSTIVFSSFFGGSDYDIAYDLTVGAAGAITVAGATKSTDLPVSGGYETYSGGNRDLFVARFTADTICCTGWRGDIDNSSGGDGSGTNVADLTYLVRFLFHDGPIPLCPEAADVNPGGEPGVNIADITYLVAFLFQGGPLPAACPGSG